MGSVMEPEPVVAAAEPPPDLERWAPASPPPAARRRPLPPSVNLACFLLTIVTTLVAGTLMTLGDLSWATMWDVLLTPSYWTLGIPYSLSLILILGTHEMGHYVACRLYRIDASLPFFLPAPHLFGTFGAVIRIRAPITHRRALFDIGVAGPIAGFIVALPIIVYGLSRSVVTRQPPHPDEIGLGSCLLLDLLQRLVLTGDPSATIRLHPVCMAGWIGLLATSLNLLPIGQLDGGHMLYALSRPVHRAVSRYGCPILIVGGLLTGGYHLVTFGVVFAFLGPGHPPLLDESEALGAGRRTIALLSLVILVLCFIPVPIQSL